MPYFLQIDQLFADYQYAGTNAIYSYCDLLIPELGDKQLTIS